MNIILTAAAFAALVAQGIPTQGIVTLGAGYRQVKLSPVALEKAKALVEQEARP